MTQLEQLDKQIEVAKNTHRLLVDGRFDGKEVMNLYKSLEWLNAVITLMLKEKNKLVEEQDGLEKSGNTNSKQTGTAEQNKPLLEA